MWNKWVRCDIPSLCTLGIYFGVRIASRLSIVLSSGLRKKCKVVVMIEIEHPDTKKEKGSMLTPLLHPGREVGSSLEPTVCSGCLEHCIGKVLNES